MKELKCPNCNRVFTVDDATFSSIAAQVKSQIVETEVNSRIALVSDKLKSEADNRLLREKASFGEQLRKAENLAAEKENRLKLMQKEIEQLRQERQAEIKAAEQKSLAANAETVAGLKEEIAQLRAELSRADADRKLALLEQQNRDEQRLAQKSLEIERLNSRIDAERNASAMREQTLIAQHADLMRLKDDEIAFYKDFKARQSTKMLGETLEQHCMNAFNQIRVNAFPEAYFEKDNKVVDGSKGDFIFRDYIDGTEYVSIMFEMKNEADTTSTKHKNEDFFDKLDKDRRRKECEYAVLVSLLEQDNELYNNGITDVSYRYEKMYVVRPQFFIPLISLLASASRKSASHIKALEESRRQSVDVSTFEEKLEQFRDGFARNYDLASKHFEKTIDEIDKSIQHLQLIKSSLEATGRQLRLANNKVSDLTIKKLTYNNPTMKAKFAEARRNAIDNKPSSSSSSLPDPLPLSDNS